MARKRNKTDWLAIRQAYITSQDITLKELADIFGISESLILKQSAKENWTEKRKQYKEKVGHEAEFYVVDIGDGAHVIA